MEYGCGQDDVDDDGIWPWMEFSELFQSPSAVHADAPAPGPPAPVPVLTMADLTARVSELEQVVSVVLQLLARQMDPAP